MEIRTVNIEEDLEHILDSISFPVTKAELIQKAEKAGLSACGIKLLRSFPARFYRSKRELLGYYLRFRTLDVDMLCAPT
jgi:hypothetical protein